MQIKDRPEFDGRGKPAGVTPWSAAFHDDSEQNTINVEIQRAHQKAVREEYGAGWYYPLAHRVAAIAAVSVLGLVLWRMYGNTRVLLNKSTTQTLEVGAQGGMDIAVQLYPMAVVAVLLGAAVAYEVTNAVQAKKRRFVRPYYVPSTVYMVDGLETVDLVRIVTHVRPELVTAINERIAEKKVAGKPSLDPESYKATRDVQTVSARHSALLVDCATGVDIVIASLSPVPSASPDPSGLTAAVSKSFDALVEAEAALWRECERLQINDRILGLVATTGMQADEGYAATDPKVTKPKDDVQNLEAAAKTLATQLKADTGFVALIQTITNTEALSARQYGALLRGGSIDKTGRVYLDASARFNDAMDALKVYVASAGMDAVTMTPGIGGRYALATVTAAFVNSSKRLSDAVATALEGMKAAAGSTPPGLTIATFRGMSVEDQKRVLLVANVTRNTVRDLFEEERANVGYLTTRMAFLESAAVIIALITTMRFGYPLLRPRGPVRPEVDCLQSVAMRHGFMDPAADTPPDKNKLLTELEDRAGPRADYFRCEFQQNMKVSRDKLMIATKVVLLVLVFTLLTAAARSHFSEMLIDKRADIDHLSAMHASLEDICTALSTAAGSVDLEKLDGAMDDLVKARDACKLLRLLSGDVVRKPPVLGKVAKYALAGAFALTAVLVALQTMRPGLQVQRVKELRAMRVGAGAVVGGGDDTPNRVDLMKELQILQAAGSPVEMQIIALCVLLATSAYACGALGLEAIGSIQAQ